MMSFAHTFDFINARGEAFRMHVLLPKAFDTIPEAAQASLPVLLCVHGAGMSGDNFYRLAAHMVGRVTEDSSKDGVAPAVPCIGDYRPSCSPSTPIGAPSSPSDSGALRPSVYPPRPSHSGSASSTTTSSLAGNREGSAIAARPPLPLHPVRHSLNTAPQHPIVGGVMPTVMPPPATRPIPPTDSEGSQISPNTTPGAHTTLPGAVCEDFSEVTVVTVTYDMRCHGRSTFNGSESSLTLEVLTEDCREVLRYVEEQLFPTSMLFLLGHSLGAAVVAKAFQPPSHKGSVAGVVLLDCVEGTAKLSVRHMREFLQRRPNVFAAPQEAIHWFLHSGGMRTPDGAAVSVPPLLKPRADGGQGVEWRSDLQAMETVWDDWFDGLDENFLRLPLPKMLCVASVDRLDKALTVGHMQGKFQLEICGAESGHYIHDDMPAALSVKLRRFVKRAQDVKKLLKGSAFHSAKVDEGPRVRAGT